MHFLLMAPPPFPVPFSELRPQCASHHIQLDELGNTYTTIVCVHLVRNLDLAISCCQQHCLTLYSAYNCNQHLLRGSNNAISEHCWHMHIDDIWSLPLNCLCTLGGLWFVTADDTLQSEAHWILWLSPCERNLLKAFLLQLKYFSNILQMSGRTPDVQLHVRDATLCIIGHLAPNLGKCPDVFLLLQVKYFSDILWTSGWTPDVWLCTMATAFLHYQTTHAQLGRAVWCFPFLLRFKYFSDILRTSGRTPDVQICAMAADGVKMYTSTANATPR